MTPYLLTTRSLPGWWIIFELISDVFHSIDYDVFLLFFQYEVKNDMNTIYWCKIFKAPKLRQKHHIIGFEPIIGANHTTLVHHMLLHECKLEPNVDLQKWDTFSKASGKACYSDMPVDWEKCLSPIVAWAVGSKGWLVFYLMKLFN